MSSIVLGIFIANETSERKREPVKAAGYGAARSLIFPVEERTARKSKLYQGNDQISLRNEINTT